MTGDAALDEQRPKRRLAAILAADVVGYSRLVRADEDGTLYAMLELKANAAAYSQLLRSLDGGASWKTQKSPSYFAEASGTQRPTNYRIASTGGRAAWVMRWTSSGSSSPESLGIAYLGGHTRATVASVGDGSEEYDDRGYRDTAAEEDRF